MKLIVDCDTGIDDALALIYLLTSMDSAKLGLSAIPGANTTSANESVDLIGVTASFGNTTAKQSARNSLDLLDLFGHSDVPVFLGHEHALGARSFEVSPGSAFIHGINGVGDVELPHSARKVEQMPADEFFIESARRYGKDLTILATGSFTSLAAAINRAPEAIAKVGRIVLMGCALTVPGSVNAWTEANVSQDPEAADTVLRSGLPLVIVGRDVTAVTRLTTDVPARWKASGSKVGSLLGEMTAFYQRAYAVNFPALHGCFLPDPLAMAVTLDESLVTNWLSRDLSIDLDGPTRGRTIANRDRLFEAPSTRVALDYHRDVFLNRFLTLLDAQVNR